MFTVVYPCFTLLNSFTAVYSRLPCLLIFTLVYRCFSLFDLVYRCLSVLPRFPMSTLVYPCFTLFNLVYPSLFTFYPSLPEVTLFYDSLAQMFIMTIHSLYERANSSITYCYSLKKDTFFSDG